MKSMEETFNEWWDEFLRQHQEYAHRILPPNDATKEIAYEAFKAGWDDGYDAPHYTD